MLKKGALEVVVEPTHQDPPTISAKLALLSKEVPRRDIIDPKRWAITQRVQLKSALR